MVVARLYVRISAVHTAYVLPLSSVKHACREFWSAVMENRHLANPESAMEQQPSASRVYHAPLHANIKRNRFTALT